jgi:hypothetical protein
MNPICSTELWNHSLAFYHNKPHSAQSFQPHRQWVPSNTSRSSGRRSSATLCTSSFASDAGSTVIVMSSIVPPSPRGRTKPVVLVTSASRAILSTVVWCAVVTARSRCRFVLIFLGIPFTAYDAVERSHIWQACSPGVSAGLPLPL